jgi:hypothetical protein
LGNGVGRDALRLLKRPLLHRGGAEFGLEQNVERNSHIWTDDNKSYYSLKS